ncbi:flagellin N-terminal helical domain-containing protein [Rhodopirellula halodulae]|uniref:flagellin N-terminal helical domain-containing protein n=1 Tax=Rhodopirellula halodulae TaxID=2894198 RepID=UPI001E5BFD58|nr:flagellin [Rhodopirellula sp. JC737]MCC9658400.1 flagellin [Rhodopirellula sp. JC737]
MTRINTNVSSLVAQNRLQSSNTDLQQSLTRLSTGLRINAGSDDPAGLLASEALRSEITGLTKAISNTTRASQIISTADNALGQVSNLLSEVRGLFVEAANTGGLSKEEISANQLQIDSSLEAINRISQTTTFQGRKLLDGSQDFISNLGSVPGVKDFTIEQANLGATGNLDVEVNVQSAASQASVDLGGAAFDPPLNANAAASTELAVNKYYHAVSPTSGIWITGEFDTVSFVDDGNFNNFPAASITDGDLLLTYDSFDHPHSISLSASAINSLPGIEAEAVGLTYQFTQQTVTPKAVHKSLEVSRSDGGNIAIQYTDSDQAATAVSYDEQTNTVTVDLGTDEEEKAFLNIAQRINDLSSFGDGVELEATVYDSEGNEASGVAQRLDLTADDFNSINSNFEPALHDDLVFELKGSSGSETFQFSSGTTNLQIAAAVNLVSDSTGVVASTDNGLTFSSEDYGSEALVEVDVISEGANGKFEDDLNVSRAQGTDIQATVNGVEAGGKGNHFSINTASLDLSLTVEEGSSSNFSFRISGGGATFQIGPDVSSTQRATLGISSVSTGQLGGSSGRLYELGSGQAKSLENDPRGAIEVIDEVIGKVVGMRGRLGSFQSTTLESSLISLNETKANLQEAESSIRDADFAQESANLTRAQILVQSGTNVLSLANQNPRNVLSLLG